MKISKYRKQAWNTMCMFILMLISYNFLINSIVWISLSLIADEIVLHIPDLDLEPEVNVLLSNAKMVEELEQCVMNWQTHITIVIEEQQNKKPQVCDFLMFLGIYHQASHSCRTGRTCGQTQPSSV